MHFNGVTAHCQDIYATAAASAKPDDLGDWAEQFTFTDESVHQTCEGASQLCIFDSFHEPDTVDAKGISVVGCWNRWDDKKIGVERIRRQHWRQRGGSTALDNMAYNGMGSWMVCADTPGAMRATEVFSSDLSA